MREKDSSKTLLDLNENKLRKKRNDKRMGSIDSNIKNSGGKWKPLDGKELESEKREIVAKLNLKTINQPKTLSRSYTIGEI